MSGVATAIVGGAVIGAGASYLASESQADAAKEGMKAEQQMSAANIEFQREMAAAQRKDFAPWTKAGGKALDKLWAGIQSGEFEPGKFDPGKFDPTQIDLEADPGYKFRMSEGVEALDKSAAARGRLLSGAQNKAITGFAQDSASQEYGNAYARYADKYSKDYAREADIYAKETDAKSRKYNMLSGLSQQGQASAARQAGATSQLAQTGGNIMAQSGQTQNVAQQNIGAARAGAYQGGAQAVNQAGQNWMLYNALGK